MEFNLSLYGGALIQKKAVNEIMKCNEMTEKFGLVLTETQAAALMETRSNALKENGRIEFGSGIIDKIIKEFCDSPYISINNYEETLKNLVDIFYYYKNDTLDLISDDELIKYMKNAFDGKCQGSIELLADRELYRLAENLRYGYEPEYTGDAELGEYMEDEDE